MNTATLLTQRLELVYDWYTGMIDPDTGMLEYLYVPQADTCLRENCPIRDIAAVWNVAVLSRFLNRHELRPLIQRSLRHFDDYLLEWNDSLILDPARLGEPANIAHSAFLILALLHAPGTRKDETIAALAEGILQQQRDNGSYQVYFDNRPDEGEELYAGEVMLALLETYRQLPDTRYLQSAERGIAFYDARYFRSGLVGDDVLVFFANWQSQAGRLLAESTRSNTVRQDVIRYIYRLHDRIIDNGFYEGVEHRPSRQVSVEVASGLEGLNEAYALARTVNDEHAERYRRCIGTGLAYLLRLQCTEGETARERGGFGLALKQRAQRIDITGHAANALMKCAANKIEFPSPATSCVTT